MNDSLISFRDAVKVVHAEIKQSAGWFKEASRKRMQTIGLRDISWAIGERAFKFISGDHRR